MTTQLPSSASTRPRRPARPVDVDAELDTYHAIATIAERLLEDGLILTEARTVRAADGDLGRVAGELLLPRGIDPDGAYALGDELLRLVTIVEAFTVTRDFTRRIRLVIVWDRSSGST